MLPAKLWTLPKNLMMPEHIIHLIGVAGNSLAKKDFDLMGKCSAIVVSERMRPDILTGLPDYPSSRIFSVLPLQAALAAIEEGLGRGDVAVLASGDPLFFGIGALVGKHFGTGRLRITPAVSSMQLAFARLGVSWHDAIFLSLHGRERTHLARRILSSSKVCILTDRQNSPANIAQELLATLSPEQIRCCRCFVGEDLGSENERQTLGSLAEIAKNRYSDRNVLIILQNVTDKEAHPVFGLQEHQFQHSRGLITKDEIRAAVIHALALPRRGVFWDIGAGSGSVSLEAARLAEDLDIYAVERHDEQLSHIACNRVRYSAWNIEPVKGEAPEILARLPDPDRVFIGGSGGNLESIINIVSVRLKVGGRIVVTAVLDKTSTDAPQFLYARGLEVEIKKIEVSRQHYPLTDISRLNPISIIIGRKYEKLQGEA